MRKGLGMLPRLQSRLAGRYAPAPEGDELDEDNMLQVNPLIAASEDAPPTSQPRPCMQAGLQNELRANTEIYFHQGRELVPQFALHLDHVSTMLEHVLPPVELLAKENALRRDVMQVLSGQTSDNDKSLIHVALRLETKLRLRPHLVHQLVPATMSTTCAPVQVDLLSVI